jgi:hypothetical protein
MRVKRIAGIALLGGFVLGGALSVALLVGALDVGSDGADEASTSSLPEQAGDGASDASDSGVGEGIEVHGDWVIEVRNTDGSLAERREFENALHSQGQQTLANFLARQYFVGAWGVHLSGSPDGNSSPCTFNTGVGDCLVHENFPPAFQGFGGVEKFPALTVTTDPAPCCSGTTVVLQGNFDASRDGNIGNVLTSMCFSYPPSTDPSTCNNAGTFTATSLQAPVNVTAGQQVLVTVRISFS